MIEVFLSRILEVLALCSLQVTLYWSREGVTLRIPALAIGHRCREAQLLLFILMSTGLRVL